MATKRSKASPERPFRLFGGSQSRDENLASISVAGFKSINSVQSMAVAPLTILAGANSSGKSSMLQPLLLMKQTLDVSYDPGPLLLDGANSRVSRANDLVYGSSRSGVGGTNFNVVLEFESGRSIEFEFSTGVKKRPIDVVRMTIDSPSLLPVTANVRPSSTDAELREFVDLESLSVLNRQAIDGKFEVATDRFFLALRYLVPEGQSRVHYSVTNPLRAVVEQTLTRIIHLPGLRGNPERSYPRTAYSRTFPGQFQDYVASIVAHWQESKISELQWVAGHLERLGLTWKVVAREVDDTKVELQVGRLPHARQGGAHDLVNIADVGLGVSQILPVLVALRVALPRQVVVIEQPEIHLHPRAQSLLAAPLAEAASRGVRVIVETHSGLLIRAIQTLIARGKLDQRKVALHWFSRDTLSGATSIASVVPDEFGAFGDWPTDFDDVALDSDGAYLDAVAERHG